MDNKLNKKGKLFRWTEQSARWYEEANNYSNYNKILAEKICAAVPADAHCCELACGNGALARSVSPHVQAYTVNDIDPNAINWVRNKVKEQGYTNIEIIEGDWRKVLTEKSYDAVIFSFFGAVLKDWNRLKEIAKKTVIIITPRNRKEFVGGKFKNGHSHETYESLIDFFDTHNIEYKAEALDLEFGQPFYNLQDALAYIDYYYSLTGSDAEEFMEAKFKKTDFGWYFPKRKEIGFIIAKTH